MIRCIRFVGIVVALGALVATSSAADKRPMTVEDMFKFKRVAAPQISPDGTRVAYHVSTVNFDANKSSAAIYVAATDGKTPPKQITDAKDKKDTNPRWSPDGKAILFESTRSGTSQLWTVPADGGEPKQLTDISTGAANGIWSPDGKHVAFSSAVYPEFSEKPFAASDKLNKEKDEEIEKSPVKAKVFTRLFYRHWDEYVGDKRQHLFAIGGDGKDCRDVTPGDRDAFPTSDTFSSGDNFTFTPDSKHLVFTAVPAKDEAWSTNHDICRVSITNTSTKWENLTPDNKAADGGPKFSPNGKKLAWRAQKKAGYEADKWDIVMADCKPDGTLVGKPINITDSKDISVDEFTWADNDSFLFAGEKEARTLIFSVLFHDGAYGVFNLPFVNGMCSSVTASINVFTYSQAMMNRPAQVMALTFPGKAPKSVAIDHANDTLLDELDLPRPESVKVKIEGGEMQMWILKPPGFDPKKKWPVAFLVHGGPQGAWEDNWSYRWNPELWAAQGYVVALPNPRGSTGFGQKFVDEISGDWGGKCYRDLVAGLDYVEKLPYVDKDRMAAAGASFGGYMMDWFAVNDIAPRFKCLISHCSVWNFESMWGTTDELWFDEYEHGGLPWEIPGKYREFSPHTKAGNLGKFKTPMLAHPERPRFPLSRSARVTNSSRRYNVRACRAGSSTSRTKGTGC